MVGLMDGNHEVGAESSANWKLIAEIASPEGELAPALLQPFVSCPETIFWKYRVIAPKFVGAPEVAGSSLCLHSQATT